MIESCFQRASLELLQSRLGPKLHLETQSESNELGETRGKLCPTAGQEAKLGIGQYEVGVKNQKWTRATPWDEVDGYKSKSEKEKSGCGTVEEGRHASRNLKCNCVVRGRLRGEYGAFRSGLHKARECRKCV